MANVEDSLVDEEFDDEEGGKEGKGGGITELLARFGPYIAVVLVSVGISIFSFWLVWGSKKGTNTSSYSNRTYSVTAARDVYSIPEFKLPLDKKDGESFSTIVQVELVIAYEKNNRKVEDELIKRKEQIKDKVQYIIAKKSYEEISTATSREELLKKDLLYALRQIIEGEIFDIYFSKFVIARVAG
ncbi:MAG: hypothetical protein IEMM0008_1003 [bacterium]|nr:MAG: hypothetical protein IEMM0008_1003 [bacterium]